MCKPFSVTHTWAERLRLETHYPHVTWAHMMLGCGRWFNVEFYGSDSHFCHSAYVMWPCVEFWSVHVPACLSNFCCRTHFVRRSSDVTSCFQKWWKCLLKKCANGPLYMTPDYRDQHMRANTWEGIGKELKIKHKFYVSSRDVRRVCPRLYTHAVEVLYIVIFKPLHFNPYPANVENMVSS